MSLTTVPGKNVSNAIVPRSIVPEPPARKPGLVPACTTPEPADSDKCRYCDCRDACRFGGLAEAAAGVGA